MAQDNPQSKGYTGADAQNTPDARAIHNSSTFGPDMLGYEFYDTLRFGEYHPFTAMEVVPKDIVTAQFKHNIMSYTLKAPLMQGIQVKKSIFQVPREAILPFNWEKWFKNPVIGQDVPDDVGTSIAGFWTKIKQICEPLWVDFQTTIQGNEPTDKAGFIHNMFRTLVILEYFYSNGSLLKSLNISGSQFFRTYDATGDRTYSYDKLFDKIISIFANEFGSNPYGGYAFIVTIGGKSYRVYVEIPENVNNTTNCLNLREFLCMIRDEPIFTISSVDATYFSSFFTIIKNDQDILLSSIEDDDEEPIDLKRLWAYNLVCAHFMTNDKVDFIYSAELYRSYISQLVTDVNHNGTSGSGVTASQFTVNGLNYNYDWMSAYYFNMIVYEFVDNGQITMDAAWAYLATLFSYKRSLRYLDYFTGSRTQPLAVGDVNVQVNSNLVNIVESEQKRFLARMLNAINVAGMRQYVKELFGVEQAPDWHNPQSLITMADNVYGERVENTGDAQWTKANSVTSTLTGASDRYAFKMFFDRSSVLIGIAYFDIPRVYAYATERQNMHFDRFDEFQPMMEYIGDQKLYKGELGTPKFVSGGSSLMDAFGYKLRNCEYKERYAQCAGGFVESLPGYIFKADILETVNITQQGSSFIRSFPSELDKFYLSLTGYSNGTYFHFICKWVNRYSAKRPMSYAPTLL